jgi:hypothetical protein
MCNCTKRFCLGRPLEFIATGHSSLLPPLFKFSSLRLTIFALSLQRDHIHTVQDGLSGLSKPNLCNSRNRLEQLVQAIMSSCNAKFRFSYFLPLRVRHFTIYQSDTGMETRTVKLPKALPNMSWQLMPTLVVEHHD